MAERGPYARLDFQQLLVDARNRWLRPAEICEILSNYQKFHISSEPPNRPPSGSLFLFDRKVLRYFRKDGHNWRKKKDRKTVKEAHEKLKVGSVDVLHCYYAHGEENENFQRRSYWMLEQDLMHIVFVHYLEVKGNRANAGGIGEIDEVTLDLQKGSPWTSSPSNSNCRTPSGYTEYTSPSSTLTSSFEDADSGDSRQASSLFHSGFEPPQMGNGPLVDKEDIILSLHPRFNNHDGLSSVNGAGYRPYFEKDLHLYSNGSTCVIDSQKTLGAGSWEEIFEQCTTGFDTVTSRGSESSIQISSAGVPVEQQNITSAEILAGNGKLKQEFGSSLPFQTNWQGTRANAGGIRKIDEVTPDLQKDSPWTPSPSNSNCRTPSGYTEYTSPSGTLTSSFEDADSGDSRQASSLFNSGLEPPQMGNGPLVNKADIDLSLYPHFNNYDSQSSLHGADYRPYFEKDRHLYSDDSTCVVESQKTLGAGSWEEIFEQCTTGFDTVTSHASESSIEISPAGVPIEQQNITSELLAGNGKLKQEFGRSLPFQTNWQLPLGDNSLQFPKWSLDQSMNSQLPSNLDTWLFEQRTPELVATHPNQRNEQLVQNNLQAQLPNAESQCLNMSSSEHEISKDGNINYAFTLRQKLLDREEGLKKVDSFSRWVSKELGEVDDLQMQSSSGISWSTVECGNVVDDSSLSPSISQDQLFSIVDFSPKWAYTDSEIEVLVIGTFLISQKEVTKYNWSCMFGEVEVPAEVLAGGVLFCFAPLHNAGQVPFYVTCSNRLACSEVREFDYQVGSTKCSDITDICNDATEEMHLHLRLERLLSLRSVSPSGQLFEGVKEKKNLISKIISLKEEEEYLYVAEPTLVNDLLQHEGMEHLLKLMKEKLYTWLLHKAIEDGKGPTVLDGKGQGVLHLAAGLGYDWAIKPIVTAGVSINFRDVNGWTALHWAAFYGREQTVAVLVSLGAAPGVLTDPSPEFPLGRTPADLASINRHKGISGFLAESSLTNYLDSLTMNDAKEGGAAEISIKKSVKTFSERVATPLSYSGMPDALSLKDSLTAVTNATQAADRIRQMFRMQSFERRKLTQYDNVENERVISLIASKSHKVGPVNGLTHTAAIQIQKKFRGWKKRKEFLIIRQRIVKIQAHVRGHQVRKQYKAITWSVGILEKVILRWRRKGTGLRGFRPDAVAKVLNPQSVPVEDEDYDFLKKGRKQTEERLQKALTRVKSMVQYPEGQAQYGRLLNVVKGFRETKVSDMGMDGSEGKDEGGDDLIDVDKLLDDDTFMSIAFD